MGHAAAAALEVAERMNVQRAASYLSIAKSTLDKMRGDGRGPRYLRLGTRVYYRREDLDEYLRGRIVETTDSRSAA